MSARKNSAWTTPSFLNEAASSSSTTTSSVSLKTVCSHVEEEPVLQELTGVVLPTKPRMCDWIYMLWFILSLVEIFFFLLFLGMVMYDNNMIMSLKQKKRKFEPRINWTTTYIPAGSGRGKNLHWASFQIRCIALRGLQTSKEFWVFLFRQSS